MSIKVREGRAGARRLLIGLVANGVDYAEDGGESVLSRTYRNCVVWCGIV